MGTAPPEKEKRNLNLYKDYKSGKVSMIDLVLKYQISSARIYQIIKKIKLDKDRGI